jgi:hypothetical protein
LLPAFADASSLGRERRRDGLLRDRIPGALFELLAEAGHYPETEQSEAFAA